MSICLRSFVVAEDGRNIFTTSRGGVDGVITS